MTVRVVPYDPTWPARFEAEANRIANALEDAVVRIHHIGSTAVPGLHAKPILDLLLETPDLSRLDERSFVMEPLAYEAKGEYGLPGRRYFRRSDAAGVRTHHLHAYTAGSPEVTRHLAFRDYMRAHPEIAASYGELKLRLARRHADNRAAYVDGKDAFVKHHQLEALRWLATQRSEPLTR